MNRSRDEAEQIAYEARQDELGDETPEEHEKAVQAEFERLCADPDFTWEAIGSAAIHGLLKHYRDRYKNLGVLIGKAIATEDEAELGRLLMPNARAYLLEIAEGRV